MDVISVLAQKGGVGKTTLTLHWAVEAERQKYGRVAVIDMDPQGSAASWSQRRLELQDTDTPVMILADETNLRHVLQRCTEAGVGLVFIDTIPSVERPIVIAGKAADLVVIPSGPSAVDIEGIGATIGILHSVKKPGVIVLNQGRPGSGINGKAFDKLLEYNMPVCSVQIMRRAALMDAFTDGRAVAELEPNGKGAEEIRDSWKWIVKQLKKVK